MKTPHEKAAKIMLDNLGMKEPNCFNCVWYGGEKDGLSQCNSIPAIAVQKFTNVLRADPAKSHVPFFPIVTFPGDNGEEFTVGAIIAHESGYGLNQMAWPEKYNPVFILFCMFYTTENEVNIEDKSDIDNEQDSL